VSRTQDPRLSTGEGGTTRAGRGTERATTEAGSRMTQFTVSHGVVGRSDQHPVLGRTPPNGLKLESPTVTYASVL